MEDAGVKAEDGDGMKGARVDCIGGKSGSAAQTPKGLGALL